MKEIKKGIYRSFDDEWIDVFEFYENEKNEKFVLYKKLKEDEENKVYFLSENELFLEIIYHERRQLKYVFKSK